MERVGDIEVDQHLRFQRREWVAQRVAWFAGLLLLVAAVLGLLGPGLLTHASSRAGPLEVEYDRVVRRGGEADLGVLIDGRAVAGSTVRVLVDGGYLDDVTVNSITPEPDQATSTDEGVEYSFSVVPGRDFAVTFSLVPDALWSSGGELRLPDGTSVQFSQFFLP